MNSKNRPQKKSTLQEEYLESGDSSTLKQALKQVFNYFKE